MTKNKKERAGFLMKKFTTLIKECWIMKRTLKRALKARREF